MSTQEERRKNPPAYYTEIDGRITDEGLFDDVSDDAWHEMMSRRQGVRNKHQAGSHEQKRHGWRFGSAQPLSKLRRQRQEQGDAEWDEFKRRVRGGERRPQKGGEARQPVRPGQQPAKPVNADIEEDKKASGFIAAELPAPSGYVGNDWEGPVRGWVKNDLVTAVSEASGLPYEEVNQAVKSWSDSSNDHHRESLEIQATAAEMFGGGLTPWQQQRLESTRREGHGWRDPFKNNPEGREAARKKYVKAVYENTQKKLKAAGITEVTVYRNVSYRPPEFDSYSQGDPVRTRLNALSSWTSSTRLANSGMFGGTMMKIKVPASRVFATARTGPGCLTEWEYILIGGGTDDEVTWIK